MDEKEKNKLSEITIEIRRGSGSDVAVAIPGNPRRVVFNDLFLLKAKLVAEAAVIEIYLEQDRPSLIEDYLEHRLDLLDLVNRRIPSVPEFARLTPEKDKDYFKNPKWRTLEGSVFYQILAVVLAHEIGHHMEAGFYRPKDPDQKKIAIETKADEWAYSTLSELGFPPIIGALYTSRMLSVSADAPESWKDGRSSHPNIYQRLEASFEPEETKVRELYSKIVSKNKALREAGAVFPGLPVGGLDVEALVAQHLSLQKSIKMFRERSERRNASHFARLANDERLSQTLRARSAYKAGYMFLVGFKTDRKDDVMARKYFLLAANLDHPQGCLWASTMCRNGWGGEADFVTSKQLAEKGKKLGVRLLQ